MKNTLIGSNGLKVGFVSIEQDKPIGEPSEQGEVWLAHAVIPSSSNFGPKFVVKISKEPIKDEMDTHYKIFVEEFNVLSTMDHPNIVKVFSCGIIELANNMKYPYYIMEYLGANVFPLEKALKELPSEKHCLLILNALMRIAAALEHSHDETKYHKPTYHGDVKPSNILIINPSDNSFQIKLIDFGFSRMLPKVEIADPRALAGRLPNKMSSIPRPIKAKSELHADIWQLAWAIDRLLQSYCIKGYNCFANCQGVCPIDAPADFKTLKKILADWASTNALSKAETESSTSTFHEALHELLNHAEISNLSSNFRGSLRYLSINEIGAVARIRPAYESIRIPPRQFVVYPKRIKNIISTESFGALRYTRQLGFAHLVYPGAQGTRFEHSLGVYDLACKFVQRFSGYAAFRRVCPNPKDAHLFVIAALLHDIGHFPLAHQLEELSEIDFLNGAQWNQVKRLLRGHLFHGADLIDKLAPLLMASDSAHADDTDGFGFSQDDISQLKLFFKTKTEVAKHNDNCGLSLSFRFFRELLDGAIDLDKLDYVERDAYHCGVPYGNYLDTERILDNLRVIESNSSLPIIAFHRRAVGCLEQLATARHQMYANVYWHRAVRAATVMFKHAFFIFNTLSDSSLSIENLFFSSGSDDVLLKNIHNEIKKMSICELSDGQRKKDLNGVERLMKAVAGQKRDLYKTVIDRIGDDTARRVYGGSCYEQQRQKAKIMYDILKTSKFLENDADRIGEHGILIDSRVDKQADFESVKIVDDYNKIKTLGYYVPSLSQLKTDFAVQACRIRIFVDPIILKPEYRSKEGRVNVGNIITEKIENI